MSRDKPKGGMRQKPKEKRHGDVKEDRMLVKAMVKKAAPSRC